MRAPTALLLALAALLAPFAAPCAQEESTVPSIPPDTEPPPATEDALPAPDRPWGSEAVPPVSPEEPAVPMKAVFRALDKITARVARIEVGEGETAEFGTLEITVRTCSKRPPEEPPEVTAFVEIRDMREGGGETDEEERLRSGLEGEAEPEPAPGPAVTSETVPPPASEGLAYSGWMFASSPSLAALEHPVYDVWLIDCKPR